MAPPAIAENANKLKYALECGAAKTTPPDDDSDPIYKTKIAVTDKVIYVVHYAASGETYIRNEQYRDQRFWGQEKNRQLVRCLNQASGLDDGRHYPDR
jgi:hypothetical protein